MIRTRIGGYATQIRAELRRAFDEDHTPREIARSFAAGAFITMLPTLGVGLLVFLGIVYLFDSVSKIALFASVLVFNPIVKWGVYVSSFTLGVLLLGPIDGITMADVSMRAGPEIVIRLLVGNLILAAIATAISYVVVHRLAAHYEMTKIGETIDDAVDEIVEETLET